MDLNERELEKVAGGKKIVLQDGEEWVVINDRHVKHGKRFSSEEEANEYADRRNAKLEPRDNSLGSLSVIK